MKKKIEKLSLHKKTISNLSFMQMTKHVGGSGNNYTCFNTCQVSGADIITACTCGCSAGCTVTCKGKTCRGNHC